MEEKMFAKKSRPRLFKESARATLPPRNNRTPCTRVHIRTHTHTHIPSSFALFLSLDSTRAESSRRTAIFLPSLLLDALSPSLPLPLSLSLSPSPSLPLSLSTRVIVPIVTRAKRAGRYYLLDARFIGSRVKRDRERERKREKSCKTGGL